MVVVGAVVVVEHMHPHIVIVPVTPAGSIDVAAVERLAETGERNPVTGGGGVVITAAT